LAITIKKALIAMKAPVLIYFTLLGMKATAIVCDHIYFIKKNNSAKKGVKKSLMGSLLCIGII
jgi:hypothetical protein